LTLISDMLLKRRLGSWKRKSKSKQQGKLRKLKRQQIQLKKKAAKLASKSVLKPKFLVKAKKPVVVKKSGNS